MVCCGTRRSGGDSVPIKVKLGRLVLVLVIIYQSPGTFTKFIRIFWNRIYDKNLIWKVTSRSESHNTPYTVISESGDRRGLSATAVLGNGILYWKYPCSTELQISESGDANQELKERQCSLVTQVHWDPICLAIQILQYMACCGFS